MPRNPVVTTVDDLGFVVDGVTTKAIAAATATPTVLKAGPGRLCQVLVTAVGTDAALVYDNASAASGTVIGAVPASAPVGSVYAFQMPARNGITVAGSAAMPGLTVSYA